MSRDEIGHYDRDTGPVPTDRDPYLDAYALKNRVPPPGTSAASGGSFGNAATHSILGRDITVKDIIYGRIKHHEEQSASLRVLLRLLPTELSWDQEIALRTLFNPAPMK